MSSDIVGSIKLKTMLSGMPELRLGLNDRVLFALTGRKQQFQCTHSQFHTGKSHKGLKLRQNFLSKLPTYHSRSTVLFVTKKDRVYMTTLCYLCLCRRQGEDCSNGRCEVSPVCTTLTLWERPNHFIHPSRWRVRADVLPHQYSCETPFVEFYPSHWECVIVELIISHQKKIP